MGGLKKKGTALVKFCATVLIGFVLFSADFGQNVKATLRMNDKTGQTWILMPEGPTVQWKPVEETEDPVRFDRAPKGWPGPEHPLK